MATRRFASLRHLAFLRGRVELDLRRLVGHFVDLVPDGLLNVVCGLRSPALLTCYTQFRYLRKENAAPSKPIKITCDKDKQKPVVK